MFQQLGLIGCGLMGGSFALALKQAGLVKRVVGYSLSTSSAQRAQQLGAVDVAVPSALQAAANSDLVLLAVPVAATRATLEAIEHQITKDTLIMDVGSTKSDVVESARRALHDQINVFVPCHPVAGKEVFGVENADPNLYLGSQIILTPVERTGAKQLRQAEQLWQALGCKVLKMTPEAHDAAFAAVSHLPHLIAFAFVNAIIGQASGQQHLNLAGPGFRDCTRIAAGQPTMWRDIFLANKREMLAQSKIFRRALLSMETMIENGQAEQLEKSIEQASTARRQWSKSSS